MNWNAIESNWDQIKVKVLEAWTKLTADDIDSVAGAREKLLNKIQHRYGYTREKASAEINCFLIAHDKNLNNL